MKFSRHIIDPNSLLVALAHNVMYYRGTDEGKLVNPFARVRKCDEVRSRGTGTQFQHQTMFKLVNISPLHAAFLCHFFSGVLFLAENPSLCF